MNSKYFLSFVVFLLLSINVNSQLVSDIFTLKSNHLNKRDFELEKSSLWLEKGDTSSVTNLGYYVDDKKCGWWVEFNINSQLKGITLYKFDTLVLKINFNGSKNDFYYTDSVSVYNLQYLKCSNDSSNFSKDNLKMLNFCLELDFFEILQKQRIDVYSDEIFLRYNNGLDRYIYLHFEKNVTSSIWAVSDIFELKDDLLDGEHFEFYGDSARLNSVINYSKGLLNKTSIIFNQGSVNTFVDANVKFTNYNAPTSLEFYSSVNKDLVLFENGKVLNKKEAKQFANIESCFLITNKYFYSKFNFEQYCSIKKTFSDVKSNTNYFFNGYRGSNGNRKDYEKNIIKLSNVNYDFLNSF